MPGTDYLAALTCVMTAVLALLIGVLADGIRQDRQARKNRDKGAPRS